MAILESVETPELAAGLPVEVRNRFTQSWSGGFEISGCSQSFRYHAAVGDQRGVLAGALDINTV